MTSLVCDARWRLRIDWVTMCLQIGLLVSPAFARDQQTRELVLSQQDPAASAMTQVMAPNLDALAARLALEISKRHFSSIAVFGALGPGKELTVLGPAIGDALSEALSRQAQDFQVIERSEIRERLKQERLSESMLLVGNLADWVSQLMKVRAAVFVNFGFSKSSSLIIRVGLYDASHKDDVSRITVSESFVLDASQERAAKKPLYSFAKLDDEFDRKQKWQDHAKDRPYSVEAMCVLCRHPEYPESARREKIQGEVWLNVTITPEGNVTDIALIRSAGYVFDVGSVMTARDWRFKPAKDKDGNSVSERMPIEIAFQFF